MMIKMDNCFKSSIICYATYDEEMHKNCVTKNDVVHLVCIRSSYRINNTPVPVCDGVVVLLYNSSKY